MPVISLKQTLSQPATLIRKNNNLEVIAQTLCYHFKHDGCCLYPVNFMEHNIVIRTCSNLEVHVLCGDNVLQRLVVGDRALSRPHLSGGRARALRLKTDRLTRRRALESALGVELLVLLISSPASCRRQV